MDGCARLGEKQRVEAQLEKGDGGMQVRWRHARQLGEERLQLCGYLGSTPVHGVVNDRLAHDLLVGVRYCSGCFYFNESGLRRLRRRGETRLADLRQHWIDPV